MNNKKYASSEYVVAFVDVLGTHQKILNEEECSLNIVHHSYDEAIRYMGICFDKDSLVNRRPSVRIFSDNILIYCPIIDNDVKIAFVDVLILVAMIQTEFVNNGYLVRGGIVRGTFFADDIMVWGKALLEAYNLESNVAVFPRVIIHSDFENLINIDKFQQLIQKYIDGYMYVDYMSSVFGLNENQRYSVLNTALRIVNDEIQRHCSNQRILDKLNWHKKYLLSKMDDLLGITDIVRLLRQGNML